MERSTQQALIERIMAHRAAGRGTDVAEASMLVPVSSYVDADRFVAERRMLATEPQLVGLSGLVGEPGSFAAIEVGGAPVVVTRDDDGVVRAMLNVCRHRGAEVASGCGATRRLTCPYHGWAYHLDGSSAARRRGEYFDDVETVGLTRLPLMERNGLLWVSAAPGGSLPDEPLHGAEVEIGPFDAGAYRHFASTSFNRDLNWKLAVDTFAEAWHVPALHRTTLAPMIHGDFALFDPFGPHGRMVATRRSIDQLDAVAEAERFLMPHATILWFVVPNTVLIFQQDHFQLYRTQPGSGPDSARLDVSLYVPRNSHRSDSYWQRNMDLLVEVTDTEDFATAAGIQRGYHSGAQHHVTFGRNEPALQHFHRSIGSLLGV